jgi:hypothetical protein
LEEVPRPDPSNRPAGAVIDHHDHPASRQMVVDEVCVRLRHAAPFDAKVAHSLSHQDVLQLIMHVMQHDIGITVEQRGGHRPTELHCLIRPIGVPTCATGTNTVSGSHGTCIAAAR